MADMAGAVRSDAANIHSDFALNYGLKSLFLLRHTVIQLKFRPFLRHSFRNKQKIEKDFPIDGSDSFNSEGFAFALAQTPDTRGKFLAQKLWLFLFCLIKSYI